MEKSKDPLLQFSSKSPESFASGGAAFKYAGVFQDFYEYLADFLPENAVYVLFVQVWMAGQELFHPVRVL